MRRHVSSARLFFVGQSPGSARFDLAAGVLDDVARPVGGVVDVATRVLCWALAVAVVMASGDAKQCRREQRGGEGFG
jgi:hypothetical protein